MLFKTKSSHHLPVYFTGKSILDSKGEPQKLIGIIENIQAKQDADEKLRNRIEETTLFSEASHELQDFLGISDDIFAELRKKKQAEELKKIKDSALESSLLPIVFLDIEGRVTYANHAFLQLFAFPQKDEVLGKELTALLFKNNSVDDMLEKIRNHANWTIDIQATSQNQDLIDVHISAGSVTDALGKTIGIMVTMVDIRDRIKAANAKDQMQNQLIQSAKMASLGILSAGIAHELNNPLSGVLGLSLLIEKNKETTPKMRDFAHEIFIAAQRMKGIIDHMRVFSRQSKKEDEKLLDIHIPINNSLILLNKRLKDHDVSLKLNLQNNLPPMLGDTNKLESIFQNLLVNSLDAFAGLTDNRSKSIALSTQTSFDGKLIIVYQDNAGGMSEDVTKHIFEPFFTTKGAGEGTGLGMSITHGIVESHKGIIHVDSHLSKGTCFTIYFPIAGQQPAVDIPSNSLPSLVPQKASDDRPKILAIDDEHIVVKILAEFLGDSFQVVGTTDPGKALSLIESETFDVIMTDYKMPQYSGIDILKKARMCQPETPVIFISAYVDQQRVFQIIDDDRLVSFIPKPFDDPNQLIASIRTKIRKNK